MNAHVKQSMHLSTQVFSYFHIVCIVKNHAQVTLAYAVQAIIVGLTLSIVSFDSYWNKVFLNQLWHIQFIEWTTLLALYEK